MASVLFTKFLACSVGMGLFYTLLILAAPYWGRFFAAKWSVRLWAALGVCLCLPLAPGIPAVEAFFARYPWIPVIWLAAAVLVFAFALLRQSRFRKSALHWSAEPENTAFAVKAGRLAEELNMKQAPAIRVCARVSCPTILGIGEPVLLLPHETYTDTEFDIILRHEFYHYLHSHIAYKVFLTAVCALHWFNPAVWRMRRTAQIDLEAACDDALLANASEKTRRQYSETILSVMQSPSDCPPPFSTHTYGSPLATGRRLVRLLSAPPKTGGAALLCIAVILSFLSGTAVASTAARLEAPSAPVSVPGKPGDAETESEPSSPIPAASSEASPEPGTEEDGAVSSASEPSLEDLLPDGAQASVSESDESPSEEAPSEQAPSESETPGEPEAPVPDFPLESAESVASALPGALREMSDYASQFLSTTSDGIEGIVVTGEKSSGMPSDEILMMISNRVVDAYNNGTADTSMSDPDAPRLMPMPGSINGDLPKLTDPEDFTALPRSANGYSIVIPIPDSGMQMQIWVDDNGPADHYEFDVVAVNFARSGS